MNIIDGEFVFELFNIDLYYCLESDSITIKDGENYWTQTFDYESFERELCEVKKQLDSLHGLYQYMHRPNRSMKGEVII